MVTDLERAIAQAIISRPLNDVSSLDIAKAVLVAITAAGAVVIDRSDLAALIRKASEAPNPTRASEELLDQMTAVLRFDMEPLGTAPRGATEDEDD